MANKKKTKRKVNLYGKTQLLGKIIGQEDSLRILFLLDEGGKKYTDLENEINIPHTTLLRRLKTLQTLNIIKKTPIRSRRRGTHEYILTQWGDEFMKFINKYEKHVPKDTLQMNVIEYQKTN